MALSDELQKFHDSLSCCIQNGAQHTHIVIEETDSKAVLKKVTLEAPNGDWFAFDPDKGRGKLAQMSPLLATGANHNHHRACDCVVLIRKDNQLTALYIDLKSSNPVGYSGQFQSTRQFVRYAIGLLEEFHQIKLKLSNERFVILYGGKPTSINKTTTVPKPSRSRADNAHKRAVLNQTTLYLKEFLN